MMKKYIVYNNDGRILRTGMCQAKIFLKQANEGENILEGEANDELQLISVSDKLVVDKLPMPIKVNKMEVVEDEEVVITKIPLGAAVDVDRDSHIIDDGLLVLTFDTAGKYKIKFRHFPYLDWEGEITCV